MRKTKKALLVLKIAEIRTGFIYGDYIMKRLAMLLLTAATVFAPLAAQKMTVKIATVVPARSEWDVGQRTIAQNWSKATGGQITLQFMNATAMGGESGVIQKLNAVRPGQKAPIDGAIFTSFGMYQLAPEANVLTTCVPFLFRDQGEVRLMLDNYSDDMQKVIAEKGYEVLGWFCIGWAYFYTKQPVHSVDDLKKLRLCLSSMSSPELSNAFKAMGFQTLDVPAEKLSQSIRTPGGVEGLYTLPMYAYASQYAKTLPYVADIPLCPVMATFLVSKDTWAKIPAEWRPALKQAVVDVGSSFDKKAGIDDAEYIKRFVDAGGTRVTLTEAQARKYESDFRHDVQLSYEAKNSVINKAMYDGIVELMKKHRGE